MGILGKPTTPP